MTDNLRLQQAARVGNGPGLLPTQTAGPGRSAAFLPGRENGPLVLPAAPGSSGWACAEVGGQKPREGEMLPQAL